MKLIGKDLNINLPRKYEKFARKVRLSTEEKNKISEIEHLKKEKNSSAKKVEAATRVINTTKRIDIVVDETNKISEDIKRVDEATEKSRKTFDDLNKKNDNLNKVNENAFIESLKINLNLDDDHFVNDIYNELRTNIDSKNKIKNLKLLSDLIGSRVGNFTDAKYFLAVDENSEIMAAKIKKNNGQIQFKKDREAKKILGITVKRGGESYTKSIKDNQVQRSPLGLKEALNFIFPDSHFSKVANKKNIKFHFLFTDARLNEQIEIKIIRYSSAAKGLIEESISGTGAEILKQIVPNFSNKSLNSFDLTNVDEIQKYALLKGEIDPLLEAINKDFSGEDSVIDQGVIMQEIKGQIALCVVNNGQKRKYEASLQQKQNDLNQLKTSYLNSLKELNIENLDINDVAADIDSKDKKDQINDLLTKEVEEERKKANILASEEQKAQESLQRSVLRKVKKEFIKAKKLEAAKQSYEAREMYLFDEKKYSKSARKLAGTSAVQRVNESISRIQDQINYYNKMFSMRSYLNRFLIKGFKI